MILEGKLAKTANSNIGMIEPRSGITTDARQGFSLAHIMDIILSGLTYIICLCYLVFGRDMNKHCERLETVLLRLREHNLRVKLSKCKIATRQVAFLGHVISQSGIQPDPAKIAAVRDIPRPQSIRDIRSFLGLAGYYRKFIPGFATVAAPLVQLTEKTSSFCWSDECENSFSRLKLLLCSAPMYK